MLVSRVSPPASVHYNYTQSNTNADDNPTHSTIILGYLMFSRGIGNILSTPISTALSSSNSSSTTPKADVHLGFGVDNGKYEKVIVYVGTCFAGAAVISLMGWAGEKRRANRRRQ
jgi:MFS transporter, MCT family, solute carrier family 16 (monocarboxylic acid transporters), member 10